MDGRELGDAVKLAKSIMQVRNLVNRPANLLTPQLFAEAVRKMAQELPVTVQVYERDELAARGLGAMLSVGDSSGNPPCLIVLRYNGAPDSDERLGYVGKGVTCDSGGYCLKAANSMAGMKGDMAGGAAVAGAVCALAANGVKELLVVAQDTSRYGTDFPGHKRQLAQLLRGLCQIDGLQWIRIHYTYPDEIDDELIEVMATEPKIVKYLDIPIQHCNSKILQLMNRRGDRVLLEELFAKLRARIPGLILRTSVITGLPGEGEEEFAELCEFLQQQKLERVGAFPFSPEEGTPAADMEFVDSEIAQQRAQRIEEIQSRIMDEYNTSMQGKTVEVLVDGFDEELEQFYGRTYADSPEIDSRVWIASDDALMEGTFVQVCIDGVADGELTGYVVEEER